MKKFKRGQMVTILWRKNNYTGRYNGWDNGKKRHQVRFPVNTNYGNRLMSLEVKDADILDKNSVEA